MKMEPCYLGTLKRSDPLYDILYADVCPSVRDPVFHVDLISLDKVYKYTEEKSRTAIIGKFFKPGDSASGRALRIKGEFDKLCQLRRYGFDASPHYVVRPISRDENIGLALTEEFISGRSLDYFLEKAAGSGKGHNPLVVALGKLASFLSALHSRTRDGALVDLAPVLAHYSKVVSKLVRQQVLSRREMSGVLRLVEKWLKRPFLARARSSIVHGDATPTNFLFTESGDVVAIDLERMKNADPVFDAGMVCGELKHAFLWRTGDPSAAEPYISHFLRSYSKPAAPKEKDKAFLRTARRNPFYMALAEFRIARNGYLGSQYRRTIALEAMSCLKWGLRI
ncbi:MAG: aminoglycoside phosphotransferase family protein [Nitrospiraceae bacterium]|nr:aminoglycoside phosphotransferase family protein [Nitrospiraceae bacterium]